MRVHLETIIIFGQNLEKLKAFYVDILQLTIIEEFKKEWLLLNAGNCNIGLHKIGDAYNTNDEEFKFDNNTKLVFEITENIISLREELIAKKIKMQEVKTFENYNYWICDGEDPEGNIFQLKQKK